MGKPAGKPLLRMLMTICSLGEESKDPAKIPVKKIIEERRAQSGRSRLVLAPRTRARQAVFLSTLDVYEAWSFVWYAWLAAVLQRVASAAFGRENPRRVAH